MDFYREACLNEGNERNSYKDNAKASDTYSLLNLVFEMELHAALFKCH